MSNQSHYLNLFYFVNFFLLDFNILNFYFICASRRDGLLSFLFCWLAVIVEWPLEIVYILLLFSIILLNFNFLLLLLVFILFYFHLFFNFFQDFFLNYILNRSFFFNYNFLFRKLTFGDFLGWRGLNLDLKNIISLLHLGYLLTFLDLCLL